MKLRTLAARARVAHKLYPDWTPTKIAVSIGSTRQAVEAALAVTHERLGRPGTASSTVRLPNGLLRRARATAKREGVTLREFIAVAVADHIMRIEANGPSIVFRREDGAPVAVLRARAAKAKASK